VVSMAGGYGRVIEKTVEVQVATIEAACRSCRQWNNRAA